MDLLGWAILRRHLIAMHTVQERTAGVRAIGVLIRQRCAQIALGVPTLAGHNAGVTADAGIKVDHKAKLDGRGGRQARHRAQPHCSDFSSKIGEGRPLILRTCSRLFKTCRRIIRGLSGQRQRGRRQSDLVLPEKGCGRCPHR